MHRQQDCHPRRRTTRSLTRVFAAGMTLAATALFPASCMTRPVAHIVPTLSDGATIQATQRSITKIDLLFMIDNSASMGDKQEYLKLAIPDLIDRLVSPNCVDDDDVFLARSTLGADGSASCSKGDLEFPPVHDMHIGIVSSSLGGQGGDACAPYKVEATGLPAHVDDRGHLIARGGTSEASIAATEPSSFLAWRPNVTENQNAPAPIGATAVTRIDDLKHDFEDMVAGVGEYGCGLEAQLESWYRFLVQPDPYDSIKLGGTLDGIDAALLKQRHDFLRPDSLVAIIDVTDENDSEIDVRSYGGYGVNFVKKETTWRPARGSAICATSPNDPNCHSCDEDGHKEDPGCAPARYSADPNDPLSKQDLSNLDNFNLRHVHMKQRYGINPQYPLSRYKIGLSEGRVPDRNGEYPAGARSYVGKAGCTNPLFAASLPDGTDTSPEALCNLPLNVDPNSRRPGLNGVIYAHIGGVPYQLLVDPATNAPKALAESDWDKILGHDPDNYDFTGIDPHMIESVAPRSGLSAPSSADDADPINGREWDTSILANGGSDLQYACTFTLPSAKDCTNAASAQGCDCPTGATTATHGQLPPLCDTTTPTLQRKAKTYPTIRELQLVKAMGSQGIAASLCPIHTKDDATGSDPLFGYRPAVASIVDAVKRFITNQCLPRALVPESDGHVGCLILETEPTPGPESACDAIPGRKQPDPDVLARFRQSESNSASSQFPVCEVNQLGGADIVNGTCRHAANAGWCYVTGKAAGKCEQSILFSSAGNPQSNAKLTLQCIESIPAPPE